MSEIMLRRSLSASSLLKQAAAAVQAQQAGSATAARDRPPIARATSDFAALALASRRRSRENTSVFPSGTTSGVTSPGAETRHIHFNEQVAQCIALEMKGDDDGDAGAYPGRDDSDDSDSDDGAIMMKRSASKRSFPSPGPRKPHPPTPTTDIETIAMLPSTTLKYRDDTPEPQESALKHTTSWTLALSPSPSQETLRPAGAGAPSRAFPLHAPRSSALDDDDDWPPPPLPPRRDSVSLAQDRLSGLRISEDLGEEEAQAGMHRTPSGMFMPLEEDEDDVVGEGLFGRVVETVNTARDIAHVIWNVGWRR